MEQNLFGNRIKALRAEKGITQEKLLKELNNALKMERPYSGLTLSAWENGRKMPTATTLITLSQIFECTVDYLLGLTDERDFTSSSQASGASSNNSYDYPTDIAITLRELNSYDKKPVFVKFNNSKLLDAWGIIDAKNQRIVFADKMVPISNKFNYYSSHVISSTGFSVEGRKPYSYTTMLKTKDMWVEMIGAEGFIRGRYNGIWHHNEQHTCLVNSLGLTLPYDGLGISYNAYSLE